MWGKCPQELYDLLESSWEWGKKFKNSEVHCNFHLVLHSFKHFCFLQLSMCCCLPADVSCRIVGALGLILVFSAMKNTPTFSRKCRWSFEYLGQEFPPKNRLLSSWDRIVAIPRNGSIQYFPHFSYTFLSFSASYSSKTKADTLFA